MNNSFAIIYINLGPYHIARLRALSAVLPDVIAVEIACEQKLYPWRPARDDLGFLHVTLFEKPFESLSAGEQKKAITRILEEIRPSCLVSAGYFDACMRAATAWANRNSIPAIMTTTSTAMDKRRFFLKESLKGYWCRERYGALCLSGEKSIEYFAHLGYPAHLIWRCGNVVDNELFESAARRITVDAERERAQRRLPQGYFLTVGRLNAEKNILVLLSAFSTYKNNGGNWDLVIVGSGPQEQELKAFVRNYRVPNVHFVPWKQTPDLPAYYALASCFILPSVSETWGLVVNEAMACGLPVLVSRQCGCVPELCHRGVNGYDFDPYDVEYLTRLMLRMSNGSEDLEGMGRASRRIVANYTPETWALSLKDCILTTIERYGAVRKTGTKATSF